MSRITATLLLAMSALLSRTALSANADAIYFGGPILTVNDKAPSVQALAVKGGKISAVGARAAVMAAEKGAHTRLINLHGHTLIPGFYDAHSHFYQVGLQSASANLLPPPDGTATSVAQIQDILRKHIADSAFVKQYGIAIGFNYDDSLLAERRAPNRQELDAVSTEVPIFVIHQSGHLGAFNSKALAMAGITADSPNPPGGRIQREADGKTPNGVLEEVAYMTAALKLIPQFTAAQATELLLMSQHVYLSNGYTTAEEGRALPPMLSLMAAAAAAGALKLDVVAYADLVTYENDPILHGPFMSRNYTNHFRIGGIKLAFDGSPQGKTAWFTQPYFKVPEGEKPDYRGYPTMDKPGEAERLVKLAFANHWQVFAHANGDAAIQQFIDCVVAAEKEYPEPDRRTVLIHGQYLRPDQIPQLKAADIFPALFPMHTFYWGDWHRESVAGPERAAFISPTGAVLAAGMKFSIHHDAPVTFPNAMRVFDSAVNRTTRSGYVLGPEQRISPAVALKAMTLWPAYQHFEDDTKGSLEVGKSADLAILSANPLAVRPETIKDIKVIETIKDGVTVYSAPVAH